VAERAGRPAEQARPRDAEVVDVAARVFHERGYADATVQDIADALGILKGSLYYYIDTKEDLLHRILHEVHVDVDGVLHEVKAQDIAPLDALRLYVRRMIEYTTHNLVKISVYYHDLDRLAPARRTEIARGRRAHQDYVTELIEAAQARGELDPSLDARIEANLVFAVVIWPYRWYRHTGRIGRDELAEMCIQFIVGGLRHGATGARPGPPSPA
jgi:AcrR family transcriptional regulator